MTHSSEALTEKFPFRFFEFFLILTVVTVPLYQGAVHLWSLSVSALCLELGFGIYWLTTPKSRAVSAIRTPVSFWIGLYLLVHLVSSFHSLIVYRTLVDSFKLTGVLATFFATLSYCRSRVQIHRLAAVLAMTGGALSLAGLLQYLGGLPKDWWAVSYFLSSVYVNHNHFAGFLEIVLPLSLGLTIAETDPAKKILFVFLCGLMGTAFVFTLSRGGYASAAMTLVLAFIFFSRRGLFKRAWWPLAVFVLLILVAVSFFGIQPVQERIQTVRQGLGQEASFSERALIWKGTLAVISKYFWWGSGPGTFGDAFLKFRPAGIVSRPVYAHNDYLNLLSDCGVIAFLVVLAGFLTLILCGLKRIKHSDSRLKTAVGCGALAAIFSLGIHSLFDFNFHIPANWMLAGVAGGMLLSVEDRRTMAPALAQRLHSLLIPVLSAAVIAGSVLFGSSDFFLWKAHRAFDAGELAAADQYAAHSLKINPWNPSAYYLKGALMERQGRVQKAYESFKQAARLNPLEPYHDYHAAKNLLVLSGGDLQAALADYEKALAKDPGDPKLSYFTGRDLAIANRRHDKILEDKMLEIFEKTIALDSTYATAVYQRLWDYYDRRLMPLEVFGKRVPAGRPGFIRFLEKYNLWGYHRGYFLESLGIDPEWKYVFSRSELWERRGSESFELKDFTPARREEFYQDRFFYRNGEVQKKITLKGPWTRLVLRAKGSIAAGAYPYVIIRMDGRVVDTLYLDSPLYADFYAILHADPGVHALGIEFVNDYAGGIPRRDRNVWIEAIRLESPKNPETFVEPIGK